MDRYAQADGRTRQLLKNIRELGIEAPSNDPLAPEMVAGELSHRYPRYLQWPAVTVRVYDDGIGAWFIRPNDDPERRPDVVATSPAAELNLLRLIKHRVRRMP